MKNKKTKTWIWLLAIAVVVIFVIPLLSAILAIRFPLADLLSEKESYKTYEGTEYSYFYAADAERAQKDFEDIAYYFQDFDVREEIVAIIKTAINPGDAAQVLKEELHTDLADYNIGISKLYEETTEK